MNGSTPDFFVADVHETSSSRRRLLVPPGNYQVTVLNCCGARQVYSGEISVAENQATVVSLKGGEKKTVDWKEGSRLTSLPRFQAAGSSDTIAVARPTAQLSASAGQIACGGTSQLKWTTSDAPRVDLSGVGQVAVNGEQSVQPKQNTNYKLTATGPGGVVTSDAAVNVDSAIQASLTVTPAEIRYHKVGDQVEAGSATIAWSAPGADNASLDPFGSVSPTGNRSVQPTPSKTMWDRSMRRSLTPCAVRMPAAGPASRPRACTLWATSCADHGTEHRQQRLLPHRPPYAPQA